MLTFDLNVTHGDPGREQPDPGICRRHRLGADHGGRLRHAGAGQRAEASAIFHLLRNIGSSFFISLSIAEIVRTAGANYSRMTEMITPYNRALATAGADRRVELRHRAGPRQGRQGNRAPIDDDRLSECVHDVHGNLRSRGRVRSDGPAAPQTHSCRGLTLTTRATVRLVSTRQMPRPTALLHRGTRAISAVPLTVLSP